MTTHDHLPHKHGKPKDEDGADENARRDRLRFKDSIRDLCVVKAQVEPFCEGVEDDRVEHERKDDGHSVRSLIRSIP